ncbi:hypothetical protein [Paraburkholderia sp.]|nr:hypothetical protein [Paraburkholderia sp.]
MRGIDKRNGCDIDVLAAMTTRTASDTTAQPAAGADLGAGGEPAG